MCTEQIPSNQFDLGSILYEKQMSFFLNSEIEEKVRSGYKHRFIYHYFKINIILFVRSLPIMNQDRDVGVNFLAVMLHLEPTDTLTSTRVVSVEDLDKSC